MTEFDPHSVPSFPVYTLFWDDQTKRVELDGMPLEPSVDQDYKAVGIDAVKHKATAQNLDAVRVMVRSTNGNEWQMVVTQDGRVYDTTPPEEEQAKPKKYRPYIIGGAAAVLAVGVTGAVVAINLSSGQDEAPQWTTPGVHAQIPRALPSEFENYASWSVPVAKDSDVVELDTGHILSISKNNSLVARQPTTAEPTWEGAAAPRDINDVVQTQWNGQDILAAHHGRELSLWAADDLDSGFRTEQVTLDIDHEYRVELHGQEPMIDMGDWVVGIPDGQRSLQRVVVPAGTTPLTATIDDEVITVADNEFLTVTTEGDITHRTRYTPPGSDFTRPRAVWALDADHALLAWSHDNTNHVAIYRISDGELLVDAPVKRLPDHRNTLTPDTAANAAVLGDLFLSWEPDATGIQQNPGLTVETIHDAVVYGTRSNDDPARLNLRETESELESWQSYGAADQAPDLVTDDGAYIVAPQLDETILYKASTIN